MYLAAKSNTIGCRKYTQALSHAGMRRVFLTLVSHKSKSKIH